MLLNRQRKVSFATGEVSAFLAGLERELTGGREMDVRVVSDAAMRRYNRRYRAVDSPTDVLSFTPGDLLISAEAAHRQARRFGHRVEVEIKILALHGALHLLGYDHEDDRGKMARLERRWRRHFRLPDGLMERVHAL